MRSRRSLTLAHPCVLAAALNPPAVLIAQHGIENHQALDHPATVCRRRLRSSGWTIASQSGSWWTYSCDSRAASTAAASLLRVRQTSRMIVAAQAHEFGSGWSWFQQLRELGFQVFLLMVTPLRSRQ